MIEYVKSVDGEKGEDSCLKRAGGWCKPAEELGYTGPGASALKMAVGEDGTPPLQARPLWALRVVRVTGWPYQGGTAMT